MGFISSPDFPNANGHNFYCNYSITRSLQDSVMITFPVLDLYRRYDEYSNYNYYHCSDGDDWVEVSYTLS